MERDDDNDSDSKFNKKIMGLYSIEMMLVKANLTIRIIKGKCDK